MASSQYVRHMSLLFSGCLFSSDAIAQRLDFVEDDILDDVDLSNNTVVGDDEKIANLVAKLAQQNGCHRLNFSGTAIGVNVMVQISDLLRRSTVLHTLELKKLILRDWSACAEALCAGLRENTSLLRLDVSENGGLRTHMQGLLEAVGASNLRELALSGIELRVPGSFMQQAFKNLEALEIGHSCTDFSTLNWSALPKLTSLNLRGAQAIGSLRQLVNVTKLIHLDLSETPMTEECCSSVFQLLVSPDCALKTLLIAHAGIEYDGQLSLILQGITENSSLSDTLDISGSPAGQGNADTWGALAKRLHQIRRVSLRGCQLRSLHIEELVRAFFENPSVTFSLSELDVTDNLIGESDDGADWLAELLEFPQMTQLYCGNNNIQNGSAMYLKLRSMKSERNLSCEVCASRKSDSRPNQFAADQLAWLHRKGYTKLAPIADTGKKVPGPTLLRH